MATNGVFGFNKNGVVKATYNHSDSYPQCLGNAILKYAADHTVEQLNVICDSIQMIDTTIEPTPYEVDIWMPFTDLHVGSHSTKDWYCLTRNAQGNLAAYEKTKQMPAGGEIFMKERYCSYAYVINLDDNTLDFYTGAWAWARSSADTFKGVGKSKVFPLDNLPESLPEE